MSIFSYYQPPWIPLHQYNTIQSPSILHTVPHINTIHKSQFRLATCHPYTQVSEVHIHRWSSYTQAKGVECFFSPPTLSPVLKTCTLANDSASRPSSTSSSSKTCNHSASRPSTTSQHLSLVFLHTDSFIRRFSSASWRIHPSPSSRRVAASGTVHSLLLQRWRPSDPMVSLLVYSPFPPLGGNSWMLACRLWIDQIHIHVELAKSSTSESSSAILFRHSILDPIV